MAGHHLSILSALVISVLFILILRRFAHQFHFIDMPDTRKRHDGTIPLCGGIAIFAAFMLSGLLLHGTERLATPILIGFCLIALVGALDDRFNLRVVPRFAAQCIAAYLIVSSIHIQSFNLGAVIAPDAMVLIVPLVAIVAILFIVGMVNAVNMSDGIDGLAGGYAAVALFWLALMANQFANAPTMLQSFLLMAAVIGFLSFNLRHPWHRKASVFLGDAGSTLLGAALATFILLLATGQNALPFPSLMWIVILPVVDTLSLIVRRMAEHRSPFSPDRQHLHHLLMDAGLSSASTTMVLVGLAVLCGAISYATIALELPVGLVMMSLAIPFVLHTAFVRHMQIRPTIQTIHIPAPTKSTMTLPGATP